MAQYRKEVKGRSIGLKNHPHSDQNDKLSIYHF